MTMSSSILQTSFLTGNSVHTGVRAFGMTLFSSEITQMLADSKWIWIAIGLLCMLDFRFGCKESRLRRDKALKQGDKVLAEVYKFHRSRAWRRSLNKFIDYLMLMMVAEAIGAGFLPLVGVNYIFGAWVGGVIACLCEMSSIGGHFLYIHNVRIEKRTIKGYLMAFGKGFAVALARQKDPAMGEAVDEAFRKAESEEERKGKNR